MSVEVKSNEEKLELYSENFPFNLALRIKTFESEADYNKFIKNVEKTVRGAIEYKEWVSYLRDVLHINSCSITDERQDETTICIHHHPINLFTVVKAIINKKIAADEAFSTFDIALETIEIHFKNIIGYVPLLESMHEKFHNGFLQIPRDLIKGNYRSFINEYSKYLDESDLDSIHEKLSITESNCEWKRNSYALQEAV